MSERAFKYSEGMSLRDYFAAKAMNVIGMPEFWDDNFDMKREYCQRAAEISYLMADAMLKQREVTK